MLVLGDQLDRRSSAFDGFDARLDAVWMAEAAAEAGHVPSHKARIALFLSAMRHFREALEAEGARVHYRRLEDPENRGTLALELEKAALRLKPRKLVIVEPGEWRVREDIRAAAKKAGATLITEARLSKAVRSGGRWLVDTAAGSFGAGIIN